MKQFDTPKGKVTLESALDDFENELENELEDNEEEDLDLMDADKIDDDKVDDDEEDDDEVDGWDEMSEEEIVALEESVKPVRLVLSKVWENPKP